MTYQKYNAKKTTSDGITFDSKAEERRYQDLKVLEREGVIAGLEVHKRFLLFDAFTHNGETVRAIHYVADFAYIEGGQRVVEDVKGGKNGRGTRTAVFEIKRKLFLRRYPEYELRIVEA